MEILDSINGKKPSAAPAPEGTGGRVVQDRLEMKQQWAQEEEEQQVEETLNLYARAARQRMQSLAPEIPEAPETEEELEAQSQRLKLQQKCQDIAALIMVEELEEEE